MGLLLTAACKREAPAEKPKDGVSVAVAAYDLEPGATLDLANVAQRAVDPKLVSANSITADKGADAFKRKTLIRFKAGDMLLWSALEDSEPVQGLSPRVEGNGRGMWIELTTPVSPSLFLRRGDLIDVIGTFKDPATNETVSLTFVQGVKVLATASDEHRLAKAIAVLVTPEQSLQLTLATELGSLTIAVRAPSDAAPVDAGRATIHSLVAPAAKKAK